MRNLIRKSFKTIKNKGLRVFFIKATRRLLGLRKFSYKLWIEENETSEGEFNPLLERIGNFYLNPEFTVLIVAGGGKKEFLDASIQSLEKQVYKNWSVQRIPQVFNKRADQQIFGDYVVFLQEGDLLSPLALFEAASSINEKSNTKMFYSDEDFYNKSINDRFKPHFKPDWSPEYLESFNYLGNMIVLRKDLFEEKFNLVKDLSSETFNEFVLDLSLDGYAEHINKVLYHNRKDKPIPNISEEAVRSYLKEKQISALVEKTSFKNVFKIKYDLKRRPKITIVIPTKDKAEVLEKCVNSILRKSTYDNFEILVINNQCTEEKTFRYLSQLELHPKVRVLEYDLPFNFSSINNFAASKSDSDYILFLNNDTEVINPDWLEAMLAFAQREDVGVVGAKLYYENDTIQHAGVMLGAGDFAGHVFAQKPRKDEGYFFRLITPQNYMAVTGACLMIRRSIFNQVGGFEVKLPIAFNDIDLCLKVYEKDLRIVWTPFAQLYHYESLTRGLDTTSQKARRLKREGIYCKKKWGKYLKDNDPYFNHAINLIG